MKIYRYLMVFLAMVATVICSNACRQMVCSPPDISMTENMQSEGPLSHPRQGEIDFSSHYASNVRVDALYEGVKNFDELLEKSEYIVIGTVTDAYKTDALGGKAEIVVNRVVLDYESGEFEEFKLYQMNDTGALEAGETYLLFLGKQEHASDVDAFYAIGSIYEGAMPYNVETGHLIARASHIMGDALNVWLQKNIAEEDTQIEVTFAYGENH